MAAAQRSVRTAADEKGEQRSRRRSVEMGVARAVDRRDWEAAEQVDGMFSPPPSPPLEDGEADVVMG